jgi:ribosomal protein L25 (general stress protein Ctc)
MKNMENLKKQDNFETEVDEQLSKSIKSLIGKTDDFLSLSKGTQEAFKDMEIAIGLKGNPIKLGNKSLTTADEVFAALKDGSLTSSKELGRVEKGLLKSVNTDPSLRRNIAVEFAKDKNVLDELVKMNRTETSEISSYLKSKDYADDSIKEIISQMKRNGNIDEKGLFVRTPKGTKNVVKKGKNNKIPNALYARSKELLDKITSKRMTWKQILAWGAGLGIGATALWLFIKENSDVTPEGTPSVEPSPNESDWGPCFTEMLKFNEGRIVKTPNGQTVILMPSSDEYPGGLVYYSNNRVMNKKTKEMGTWSCDGSKLTVNESIGDVVSRVLRESLLSEQKVSDSQMSEYVDDAVDDLDGYVAEYNLENLKNILLKLKGKTYNGKDATKEFLRYYSEDERGDSFISDVKSVGTANLSIKAKNLKPEIIKLASSTSTVKKPVTGKSNLTIKWDKTKETTPIKTGDSNKDKKGKYGIFHDCEGKDFPLEFGCKSSKVKEIQKCLGVTVDGKLGKFTKKAMEDFKHDTSKGLTKDIYDNILNNCGGKERPSVEKLKMLDLVPGTTVTGSTPTNIELNVKSDGSKTTKTGEQVYGELVNSGLLKKDILGRLKLKEKNNLDKPIDVPSVEIEKLNDYLKTLGYKLLKEKDKSYGDKLVWIKNRNKEKK